MIRYEKTRGQQTPKIVKSRRSCSNGDQFLETIVKFMSFRISCFFLLMYSAFVILWKVALNKFIITIIIIIVIIICYYYYYYYYYFSFIGKIINEYITIIAGTA